MENQMSYNYYRPTNTSRAEKREARRQMLGDTSSKKKLHGKASDEDIIEQATRRLAQHKKMGY